MSSYNTSKAGQPTNTICHPKNNDLKTLALYNGFLCKTRTPLYYLEFTAIYVSGMNHDAVRFNILYVFFLFVALIPEYKNVYPHHPLKQIQ